MKDLSRARATARSDLVPLQVNSGVRSHEMRTVQLPPSPIRTLRTIELTPEEEPLLQRFFEQNPEYFVAAYGEPAGPKEAHEAIHGKLPAGWGFTKKWLVGYLDEAGSLVAMANVVTDLLAKDVWHIGLFIVVTARHGTGDAQALNEGIERWARDNGAKWLRLGVVRGNARAERYWESLGYIQTRTREGVQMGKLTNTVRVMVKPLVGGSIEEFLSLVPRDRPEVPSTMNIREAVESEAELLSALAMRAKAHWGYSDEVLEGWRAELAVSPQGIRARPTFVAMVGIEVAGFYSLSPLGRSWELDHLWVLPRFMHLGVGRALLSHALETAARGGAAEVTVDADPNAEPFYLECGAVRRGAVPAPLPGQPERARPQLALNARAS